MRYLSFNPSRFFHRVQRRFQRSRAGSVLILCVALLVLLALIGTAMISTARIDRYSSVQHTYNTEIDLLVEGVKSMVTATIVDDLYNQNATAQPYRQPNMPAPMGAGIPNYAFDTSNTYDTFDMPPLGSSVGSAQPTKQEDRWLANRYPVRKSPLAAYPGGIGPNN